MYGVQVLIFSQFKIMLDVIEDALKMARMPLERIDGSVASRDRQAAIDRFSQGSQNCTTYKNHFLTCGGYLERISSLIVLCTHVLPAAVAVMRDSV